VAGGGWCPEHYRAPFAATYRRPLPRHWHRVRDRILRRDNYRCPCGERATTVDHILARAFGGTDADQNLVSLCAACARRKDAADAAAGRRRP
jgi:5-methylcytosine-specific restriction protein A